MATAQPPVPQHITSPEQVPGIAPSQLPDLIVYSHSPLLYWWPVWVLGYLFALLTATQGVPVHELDTASGNPMLIHPSKNLGVIYTVVFMLVILFSNITLRGVISVAVILAAMFVTVLF